MKTDGRGRTSGGVGIVGQLAWAGAVLTLGIGAGRAALAQNAPGRGDHEPVREVGRHVAAVAHEAVTVLPAGTRSGLAAVAATALPLWAAGGTVTKTHLQALAADPKIRGEQAAALATLLHHFHKGVPTSFHAGEFAAMADRHQLDGTYRDLVARLPLIPRTLFVDGIPHFDRLRQGQAGDCFLFSGAGWMARFHPHRLVDMIRPLPGDRFEVRFPSGDHVVVAAPTDTEILMNETISTLGDGLWMAVLEKAVGTLGARHDPAAAAIPDPSLRVNLGGSGKDDVHRWTGHGVDALDLRKHAEAAQARDALVRMERRRLMAKGVVVVTDPPGPLPMNHVYAILGFDPTTDVVTVWNPWGDDTTPKGPPGLQHGWPRNHGVFQIPLRDFVRVFAYLDVEHP